MDLTSLRSTLSNLMGQDRSKQFSKLQWTDLIVGRGYVPSYNEAAELFDRFDQDGDGFISRRDLEDNLPEYLLSDHQSSSFNNQQHNSLTTQSNFANNSKHETVFSTDPIEILNQMNLKNEERILAFFKTIESQYPSLQKYFEDLLVDIISEIGELKGEKEKLEDFYKREKSANNEKIKLMEEEVELFMDRFESNMKDELKEYERKVSQINNEKCRLQEEIEYYKVQSSQPSRRSVEVDTSSTDTSLLEDQQNEWQNLQLECKLARSYNMSNEAKLKLLKNSIHDKDRDLDKAKEEFKRACSNIQSLEASLESLIHVNRKLNDDNDNLRSTLISISQCNSLKSYPTNIDPVEFVENDSGLSTQMELGESENECATNKIHRIHNYIDNQYEISHTPIDESSNCDSDVDSSVVRSRRPQHRASSASSNRDDYITRLHHRSQLRPSSVILPQDSHHTVLLESVGRSSSVTLSEAPVKLEPERMFKVILAGDTFVGKTSFMMQFCKNVFDPNLQSTVGIDYCTKTMFIDGRLIALQIWDTAGQERFRSIVQSYFRRADGILLIYDVTTPSTFINVRSWIDKIKNSSDTSSIPLMLLANKIDVRSSSTLNKKAFIQTKEGQLLAKNYKLLFQEISVKNNFNIDTAIIELARNLKAKEDVELSRIYLNEIDSKKRFCC